jgi:putative membrane protein
MGFVIRILANALAILLAAYVVPGIRVDGFMSALLAGVVLGLVNAIIRPILVFLTFPITLLTLGLFLLVLNALCFWFAAAVVGGVHVTGFLPAFLGALIVSLVSWLVTAFVSDSGRIATLRR